jgi:hypothetical protein
MIQSYLRHVLTTMAGIVIALNGEVFDASGLKALASGTLVAVLPVLIRYLNPNDEQYGRLAAPDHLDEH